MPTNKRFGTGNGVLVTCSYPASPASGGPVLFGTATGIALKTKDSAGKTVVDFSTAVWYLNVTTSGAISAGDYLFLNSTATTLSNDSSGIFFGQALAALASGSGYMNVLHIASPGAGTLGSGTVGTTNLAALAVTLAKVANDVLTSAKNAETADGDVLGTVPVIYHKTIADASADSDIIVTNKIHIIDAWIYNTGSAGHATLDTITFKNGTNAITNAIAKTAAVNILVHATTLDPTYRDVADGGTLRITAAHNTNVACEAYVLAYRIA